MTVAIRKQTPSSQNAIPASADTTAASLLPTAIKSLFILVTFTIFITWLLLGDASAEVQVMLTAVTLVITPFLLNFRFNPQYQIQRRLLHVMTGSLIVYLSHVVAVKIVYMSLFVLTLGAAVIEVSRRNVPAAARLFDLLFGNLLRSDEAQGRRVPGAFHYLPGAGLCLFLFPAEMARLGILSLAVGDPAAGVAGYLAACSEAVGSDTAGRGWLRRFLSLEVGGKSVGGFVGCGVVAGFVCAVYEVLVGELALEGCAVCVVVTRAMKLGLLAAVSESISVIDDNLTMPSVFCLLKTVVGY
jgi:dolichol kinase